MIHKRKHKKKTTTSLRLEFNVHLAKNDTLFRAHSKRITAMRKCMQLREAVGG